MQSNSENTRKESLSFREKLEVLFLSLYCISAISIPVYFFVAWYDKLFPGEENDAEGIYLIGTMILMGILGSALRGMSSLFNSVGKREYDSSWSLSILLRPFEGAGIALVSYFALTAGIIVFQQDAPNPNTAGFLFLGVLSGMFSHRAADALKNRFDQFWGQPDKDNSGDG